MTDDSANAAPRPHTPPRAALSRRTVVQATAWSVPVLAVAIATPLAAASVTPVGTLTFNPPAMSVAGCGKLTGVTVTATTDGTTPVAAGTLITITLPSGFTFTNGTASPTVMATDANGKVTLPSISVPPSAGSAFLTATSGTATGQASVTVGSVPGARIYRSTNVGTWSAMVMSGLPAGYSIRAMEASQRGAYLTLLDGTVWEEENGSIWRNTGMTGVNIADALVSEHYSSSSSWGGSLTVRADGSIYAVRTSGGQGAISAAGTIPSPSATSPVVELGGNNGIFGAKTADGRLWMTSWAGTATPVWKEVVGMPAGVTVKDWTSSPSGVVSVIGTNGILYGGAAVSANPPTLTPARSATATWVQPAHAFTRYHRLRGYESSYGLVDANGNLFYMNTTQAVNISGVLAGTLADTEIYAAPQTGAGANFYVVRNGRLYRAQSGTATGFADITPSASLLGGATIVSGHNGTGNGAAQSYAIDSNGRIWWGGSSATAINWQPAAVPVAYTAAGIIQNGNPTYAFESPTTCPV